MRKVYVFIGVIGSGKSHYADLVAKQCRAKRLDFKDALIDMTYNLLNLPKSFDYETFKSSEYINSTTGQKLLGRHFLQFLGTEIIRNQIDKDYWCKALVKKIKELPEDTPVAIADCRFMNEIKCLLAEKGFDVEFYLTRFPSERFNLNSEHESEKLAKSLTNMVEYIEDKTNPSFFKDDKFVVKIDVNFLFGE